MISSIVDTLPLSFIDFIYHFVFLLTSKKTNLVDDKKLRLYGSSSRSLFYTFLDEFCENTKTPNILVTPLQHTSFRDIIEHFFEPEQITVLPMNEEYNRIIVTDDILNTNKRYDLCIVTHLFGQDLDTTALIKLDTEHRCVFLEDRVQGGEFDMIYSSDIFHYSLYSCGMDKKPCALGGGILYSRTGNFNRMNMIKKLEERIKTYKKETITDRYLFLIKKIPTYLVYNVKLIIWIVISMFHILGINLYKFITFYRKNNPGFMHNGFNINPHKSTLNSIEYSINNIKNIEKIQANKCFFFMISIEKNKLLKYFPWYRDTPLLTVYNTITVKDRRDFIHYMNRRYIPVIDNPTYKLFNFDYPTKEDDTRFNNSLVYIPTLYTMNYYEINELIENICAYSKNSIKNI